MSHIRSRDTSTEVYIRKLLFSRGCRYRVTPKDIPGKPDLWFPGKKVAVFIHGCFWHRHEGCRLAYMPKSSVDFWQKKFDANVARDRIVKQQLQDRGIRILIIWECTVRGMRKEPDLESAMADRITDFLSGESSFEEL